MVQVTFDGGAAYLIWGWFGLFRRRQYCYACGNRVTPKTVGAFQKLDDGSIGVWHSSLPCIMALINVTNFSGLSVDEEAGDGR